MIAVRAHFDGKVLVPDEPVELPENQPLVLHIETKVHQVPAEGISADEWIEQNAIDDPSLPTDGARRHDHYLYGTPKQEGSSLEQSAMGWMIEKAINDPALPVDGSHQHDHYLYGTPKKP